MGNGALSKPEGTELMKQMKGEYEKLQSLGYGDAIIKEKLELQYNVFMKTAKGPSAPAEKVEKLAVPAVLQVTSQDAEGSKKLGKKKGGGSRRRSFESSSEPSTKVVSSKSAANLPPINDSSSGQNMANSASGVSLSTSTPPASSTQQSSTKPGDTNDHWDSVSQMPYCVICKTAFKSEGLLQRHVKYSELHKKSVAALEEQKAREGSEQVLGGNGDLTVRTSTPEVTKRLRESQKEGEDFKLLYYGSKFYWRTQDNIDLSFFHHILCDAIEVVPYDVYKNRALDRLYLDMAACKKLVPQEKVKAKGDMSDETRKALTTAILARLHLHSKVPEAAGPQSEPNRLIKYLPAATDDPTNNPLLDKAPPALIPRSVTHRRNTSNEEVKAKLHDLQRDQAALNMATEKAEKVVNVINAFAKDLKSKSKALAAMSLPRRRWVMAIRRVLQINGVAKTTLILEALAKKQAGKSPGTRRRERAKALA